jgi:hypothetical protein
MDDPHFNVIRNIVHPDAERQPDRIAGVMVSQLTALTAAQRDRGDLIPLLKRSAA